MEKITIGSLGVSKIGLGTINFGTTVSEIDAFLLLSEYQKLGGNFLDTANNYAVWNGGKGGESERVLGSWLAQTGQRQAMVLATKVGALPAKASGKEMEGLSRDTILRSVEQSLSNLQTDYLDLLYLHVDDFSTSQEETMGTLNELYEQGVIKEIGCSNFYSWRIERAKHICEAHDWKFFSALQQRYSYLSPLIDEDLTPQVALNEDMGSYLKHQPQLKLVAYSPLLAGQYNTSKILKPAYDTNKNRQMLSKLLANEVDPNRWVLEYITKQFQGTVALLTTSKVDHLRQLMI